MRSTIVPAQITTVEDRVAGNLGISQLLLLITPVFGGSALYVILPPFFGYAEYKIGIIVIIALLCGILAIRIKGKIILLWAVVRLKYNLRPMFYVYNKNSIYARHIVPSTVKEEPAAVVNSIGAKRKKIAGITATDLLKVQQLVLNPNANVRFTTTKKGELRVHLTEVPHESLSAPTN